MSTFSGMGAKEGSTWIRTKGKVVEAWGIPAVISHLCEERGKQDSF